ncbi:alpha/beta fold hydrolase [Actinoalloteichus spitiensis]|uniref:alpha/beta fold hydrolase n=1 Tax=Actinoalloteichus spitiensis TaxID=252394 RepID=UPI000374B6F2|nr:alpha/beta hydrolase [Actinoalloteichus spitiensis]
MTHVTMHDGSRLDLEITGGGPTVLLPVNPTPVTGERAEEMRRWGAEPALGRQLVDGLSDAFRVVAFDYEGHVLSRPKPTSLTPRNIAADILAVADAVGAERFAYYGYSWLALAGLQLAIRTDRLSALVMGGFPALNGPYAEMLEVTAAAHRRAGAGGAGGGHQQAPDEGEANWESVEISAPPERTRQFVTLYEALAGFDDRAASTSVRCPRLCFAGTADTIVYPESWGGVTVDIAGRLAGGRAALEEAGWDVALLDGLDHLGAMLPDAVLPVVRPWLRTALAG